MMGRLSEDYQLTDWYSSQFEPEECADGMKIFLLRRELVQDFIRCWCAFHHAQFLKEKFVERVFIEIYLVITFNCRYFGSFLVHPCNTLVRFQ